MDVRTKALGSSRPLLLRFRLPHAPCPLPSVPSDLINDFILLGNSRHKLEAHVFW